MSDAFIRRDGEDYAEAFARLLPTGEAWSRDPDGVLMQLVRGQAEIWGAVVDARAGDLLEIESDPRFTYELLGEWERAYGLPDPCVQRPQTIEERRLALVSKITAEGGQSRGFFIGLAATLGYAITIREFRPFMAGLSRAGDPAWSVGSPGIRFYWVVTVTGPRLSWFRAGQGHAGIDPLCRISRADDLECRLNRFKPAHTELLFNYTGV